MFMRLEQTLLGMDIVHEHCALKQHSGSKACAACNSLAEKSQQLVTTLVLLVRLTCAGQMTQLPGIHKQPPKSTSIPVLSRVNQACHC